jgi:hypothetical protein
MVIAETKFITWWKEVDQGLLVMLTMFAELAFSWHCHLLI